MKMQLKSQVELTRTDSNVFSLLNCQHHFVCLMGQFPTKLKPSSIYLGALTKNSAESLLFFETMISATNPS